MSSKATVAQGVKLQRGDGATPTEVFAAVAEITSIDGPKETADDVDITSMDSAGYREFAQGLKTGGEVAIEFNFIGDDASQIGLRTDFDAGTLRNFKIDLNDATVALPVSSKYAFKAIVKALGPSFKVNDKITGSATLKVSGKPTFTARAAA